MTKKLKDALRKQKKSSQPYRITGVLGIPLGGQRLVEVPNRNSYVYVRLRNNQNEVIQAYNNQVAPSYNLPVIVERQGNRYVVTSVDTERYGDNWNSFAPFLPRHGNTHSFDLSSGGGGDVVWVQSRQMMPMLVLPSGTLGAPNAFVASHTLRKNDGTWIYVGNTGTQSFAPYRPSSPTGAIMGLVYMSLTDGNPYFIINSGSVFSNTLTGSNQVVPYIPSIPDPTTQIPLAAIRLITGTNQILWNNIYDVRQWIHGVPTGTGGSGVSNLTGTSIGTPNAVVLTNSSGNLYTDPQLKWDYTSGKLFVEFGANVAGKETNAGRQGYELFSSGYYEMVGAGTSSPNRWMRFYDNVKVNSHLQTNSLQVLGLLDSWIYLNSTGTAVGPINAPQLTVITGTDYVLGIKGSDSSSVKILANDLAEGIVYTDVIGTFTGGDTVQPTGTYSSCPWKAALNSTVNNLPWPEGGLLTDLFIRTSTSQPASGSLVATLFVNGAATSLVVTIAAGSAAGSFTNSTNQVSLSSGDTIRWNVQNNATSTSAAVTGILMKLNKRATA